MTLTRQRDIDQLRGGLERWLGRPVTTVERPAPGWSCETLVVDRDTVVRLPPAGEGIFPEYDLALQAAAQEAAGRAGVPVAVPVRFEPDPSFLGAPFLTMPFVSGSIPSDFTPADRWLNGLVDDGERAAVWTSFVDTLLTVHTAEVAGVSLRHGLDAELAYWSSYVDWACDGAPPPALVDALAWCAAHRPPEEPPSALLWGDVRLGNVVFSDTTLAPKAVLDWDMTSAGPPEMDLAWFVALEAVQTELTKMTVPGFGTRADAIKRFAVHHRRVPAALPWYEVFALVRASAISTRIALLFERAGQRSMFKVGEDPTLAAAISRIEAGDALP